MGVLASILLAVGIFGLCFGYAVIKLSFPKSIQLWDLTVKSDETTNKMRMIPIFSIIPFVLGLVLWIVAMVNSLSDYDSNYFLDLVLPIIAMFIPFPFGMIFGEKKTLKAIETGKNCLVLGEYEPIKRVDQNIDKVKTIELYRDGILLKDSANYAFETILFCEYVLGNFDNAKQMVAMSCYFMQKYPHTFKRKYNENVSVSSGTGHALADTASGAVGLAVSASGQNIVSVILTRK